MEDKSIMLYITQTFSHHSMEPTFDVIYVWKSNSNLSSYIFYLRYVQRLMLYPLYLYIQYTVYVQRTHNTTHHVYDIYLINFFLGDNYIQNMIHLLSIFKWKCLTWHWHWYHFRLSFFFISPVMKLMATNVIPSTEWRWRLKLLLKCAGKWRKHENSEWNGCLVLCACCRNVTKIYRFWLDFTFGIARRVLVVVLVSQSVEEWVISPVDGRMFMLKSISDIQSSQREETKLFWMRFNGMRFCRILRGSWRKRLWRHPKAELMKKWKFFR